MYRYLILIFALSLWSCKKDSKNNTELSTTNKVEEIALSGDKAINIDESTIFWKGHKLIGSHTGKINLKTGNILFKNGDIISGTFVADMHSIGVTELMDDDDESEDEEEESPEDDKSDLANHLMDKDFFASDTFPTATFTIKKSIKKNSSYTLTGDMTIKGISKEITIDAILTNNILKSNLSINRTDFGIKYGSGSFFENLGDNVIKDSFDLILSLKLE